MVSFSAHQQLGAELARALELQNFVKESLNGASSVKSPRAVMSGMLYHLSYEHSASMLKLIGDGHVASALALLRPSYDALIRGVWSGHSASDAEIERICSRNGDFPKNGKIGSCIESNAPIALRGIANAVHRVVPEKIRHGLTHGGVEQLVYRFDGATIGARFPDDTIIGFVRAASTIMLGAAIGIAMQPGSDAEPTDLIQEFLQSFADNDAEVRNILGHIKASA